MKKCAICKTEKRLEDFVKDKRKKDLRGYYCIECESLRLKEYYKKNRERIIERQKKYSTINKEVVSDYQKKYRYNNRKELAEYLKKYIKANREIINKKEIDRREKDPLSKLRHLVRNRIYMYFKSKNYKKRNKTFEIIGCSVEELKKHIESLFTEGMSWEMVGPEIHIDHIIPLSSATNEKEMIELCNYKNLQPLWKTTRTINGKVYIGNINKSNGK